MSSIQKILDLISKDEELVKKTPLLPAELPLMLSQRFRRNKYFTSKKTNHEEEEDEDEDEDEDGISMSRTYSKGSKDKRKKDINSTLSNSNLDSSLPPIKTKSNPSKQPVNIVVSNSGDGENESPVEVKTQNAPEPEIPEYIPFQLKEKSSFNPALINDKRRAKLDPLTRAKYEAYMKPPPEINKCIGQSEIRARKWILEKRRIRMAKAEEARKRLLIHNGVEEQKSKEKGLMDALKAKERMKMKYEMIQYAKVLFIYD